MGPKGAEGALPRGAEGPPGPKGPEGPLGPKGPKGPLVPLAPWAFWPLAPPWGGGWGWGPTQGVSIRMDQKKLRCERTAPRANTVRMYSE